GGSGRSGSTLLDQMLNRHPLIQSVGEVHRLNLYARTNKETCTCGRTVMECPFWLKVQGELQRGTDTQEGPALKTREVMLQCKDLGRVANLVHRASLVLGNRWLHHGLSTAFFRRSHQAMRESQLVYDAIRRASGCPVVVDSTKDARRLKELYLTQPWPFRLIYLVRDGRAVAASAMRRLGVDMRTAARDWLDDNRRSLWVQWSIPAERKMRVRYEDLCHFTEPTLRSICRFLDVPYDESMLQLCKGESHSIGGNPMRFRRDEATVQLDERWRDELSERDLEVFNSVAGRLNRRFGNSS
ncbi:MAG: sulfotransferase, partial [Pirellulaceae bacterium]